uniref:Uncharacterized protein n=1 Tax=Anguilla anguilla TaxID=7936 RepID=A0A0E9V1E1_ANGAN
MTFLTFPFRKSESSCMRIPGAHLWKFYNKRINSHGYKHTYI